MGPRFFKDLRMADKRATPQDTSKAAAKDAAKDASQDAAKGPRRAKRAAPTIDLTAREVASTPAAPPQHAQQEAQQETQREAPHRTEQEPDQDPHAPPPAASAAKVYLSGPALAAGFAGAAVVALIMLALWLTGLMPTRSAGSAGLRARVAGLETQLHDLANRPAGAADAKAIDALSRRVDAIERSVAKLPAGDASVSERLAAADNAMKSLGLALTALSQRGDDNAAAASQARERADAAAKAVAELQASLKQAAANGAPGASPADIAALSARVAALESAAKSVRADIDKINAALAAKTNGNDAAARLALSASVLRDAVLVGAPYADELAAVKQLGGDEKALAPLAPLASAGVPDKKALAHELGALIPAMRKAAGAPPASGSFLARLQANAENLVRVRPLNAPQGNDAAATLARVEIDAADADIAAAIADLGKLPDNVRAPAAAWIAKAKARQAALDAARQFAASAAHKLGQP
jgi:hypothetical protein